MKKIILSLLLLIGLIACGSNEVDPEVIADIVNTPEPTDLTDAFIGESETNGDVLTLYGQLLDLSGSPLPNMTIEIWQTDEAGVYDHPDDPSTSSRDQTFQFYGATQTDSDGWYAFRTILPGEYEPRPRHIHFKVKDGNSTELTSQFYFTDDIVEVKDEGIFRSAGDSGDLLLLQLVQGDDTLLANGRIVLDIGSGDLPETPSQQEGPFYPVVDLANFDNDLVTLP